MGAICYIPQGDSSTTMSDNAPMTSQLLIRQLPQADYQACWRAMCDFTANRDAHTPDELWLLEHAPVFTLGRAAKPEHVLAPGDIPVISCDRGGQVTLHAPGQTVGYLMWDINRLGIGSRVLVETLEASLVELLQELNVDAHSSRSAPGIYVGQRKIASLGLRIRHGCTYHGFAFNRDMDLPLWERINPCGYIGQQVTDLKREGVAISRADLEQLLIQHLSRAFDMVPESAEAPTLTQPQTAPSP